MLSASFGPNAYLIIHLCGDILFIGILGRTGNDGAGREAGEKQAEEERAGLDFLQAQCAGHRGRLELRLLETRAWVWAVSVRKRGGEPELCVVL